MSNEPARKLSILVVEDNVQLRTLMVRVLASAGHEITETGDLGTAEQTAAEARFDLIMLDLTLPDGNGIALARDIRGGGGINAGTPILALTGHEPETVKQDYADCGLTDVLGKPVDVKTLFKAVNSATAMRAA